MCLVDGEHHPPVTLWALDELDKRGHDVKALVFLGGSEKVEDPRARLAGGWREYPIYVDGATRPPLHAIAVAVHETRAEVVVDLSDAPTVGYRDRFRIASTVLSLGAAYQGADFSFAPPLLAEVLTKPSLSIIGTGKRVGKTGLSVYLARLLRDGGFDPVVVAMGRGGPPDPEFVDPSMERLDPLTLLEVARSGRHAASDHWEDAYLAGVPTIGCRRCGGGMAGEPFFSNIVAGAHLAERLPYDFVILEGSGQAMVPVKADASLLVVGAAQPTCDVLGYLGEYRVMLADMIVVTMCEPPFIDDVRLSSLQRGLEELRPGIGIALTVFRPEPFGDVDISGKKVFLVTTSFDAALARMTTHLETHHRCEVVGATASLSDRWALRIALERGLPAADVLLTEIKAASIDIAVDEAVRRGVEVVFLNNKPVLVGGNVADLDAALLGLGRRCRDGKKASEDHR